MRREKKYVIKWIFVINNSSKNKILLFIYMDARQNQQKNLIRRRMRMRNTGIYAIPRHSERTDAAKKIQRWIKMKLWKFMIYFGK